MSRRAAIVLLAAVAFSLRVPAGAEAEDKNKDRKKRAAEEYALLFGTVFDERGLSAPGATVRVRQKDAKKKWEAVTSPRGEFSVRLPPGQATYLVEASAKGVASDQKEVSFMADERQDIALRLEGKR